MRDRIVRAGPALQRRSIAIILTVGDDAAKPTLCRNFVDEMQPRRTLHWKIAGRETPKRNPAEAGPI